jgi:hypothetical protein
MGKTTTAPEKPKNTANPKKVRNLMIFEPHFY